MLAFVAKGFPAKTVFKWSKEGEITEQECRKGDPQPPSYSTVTSHKSRWHYGMQEFPSLWTLKHHLAGKQLPAHTDVMQAVIS